MTVAKTPRGSNEPGNVTHITSRREGVLVEREPEAEGLSGEAFTQLALIARIDLDGDKQALARLGVEKLNEAQYNVMQAGAAFLKLKSLCGHGEFGEAVEALGLDDRQVRRCMSVARYVATLPADQAQRIAALPKTKILPLASADPKVVEELLDAGELDGDQALSVRELRQRLKKAEVAALDAITKKETAEGERDKLRHLALNRLNATGLPEFAIIAREESVALVETMIKALDALDAIYQDNLSAPHDDVAGAERHALAAAGTLYWSLKAAHSRADLLLNRIGARFESVQYGVSFEHQLKPAEVDHAARTFAVITGRLKVQQQNREAVRENAKGGRGRHRKLRDEA